MNPAQLRRLKLKLLYPIHNGRGLLPTDNLSPATFACVGYSEATEIAHEKPSRAAAPACLALTLILELALTPILSMAADPPRIVGTWEGVLDAGAQPKKHVVVHISADQDGSLSGTIDYPDQDVSGIQITTITYKADILHFESIPNLSSFDGTLRKESTEIAGIWKQGGTPLMLTLKRTSS